MLKVNNDFDDTNNFEAGVKLTFFAPGANIEFSALNPLPPIKKVYAENFAKFLKDNIIKYIIINCVILPY